MKTKFRLVNKSDNIVLTFSSASSVAYHLIGRRVSNYIVIKSDDKTDRVVELTSCDVAEIEKLLSTEDDQ